MKWLEHLFWSNRAMSSNIRQLYLDLPTTAPLVPTRRRRRPTGVKRVRQELESRPLPTPEKAKEDRLRLLLQSHLRAPVKLSLTDNVSRMVHVTERDGEYSVRLHRMFLEADGRVVWILARFIETGDAAMRRELMEFIEQYSFLITRPEVEPEPRGEYFDLQEIFDALNAEYFDGQLNVKITWGMRTSAPPRHHKSVKLGSYNATTKTITIHPLLDRHFVPRFFVEYVVYHEMVHAYVGSEKRGGRTYHHTERFFELERRFSRYAEAVAWERDNRVRLLYF